jgi:hypothetical protein
VVGQTEFKAARVIGRIRITVLLAISLILFSQPVIGSGGGITSVGPFTKGTAGDTGSREWVDLVGKGGLLIGRPNHNIIKLITVYAPGLNKGHLILREIGLPDGKKSLLLSAPDYLLEKTQRATLYVKHHSINMSLLEYDGAKWKQRNPLSLRVDKENNNEVFQEKLLAFTVDGLGLFYLLDGNPSDLTLSNMLLPYPSANALLGGGLPRGLLPWMAAVLLLIGGWVISKLLYTMERDKFK